MQPIDSGIPIALLAGPTDQKLRLAGSRSCDSNQGWSRTTRWRRRSGAQRDSTASSLAGRYCARHTLGGM